MIPKKIAGNGPVISIIIAVFNGERTLQRCLKSIASQTYQHKEVVVIDGGSTDATIDILRRHSGGIGYWQSEPDKGIYDAWNKALGHARGDWVCFLGADDRLFDERVLEKMAPHLQTATRIARLVYGQVVLVNSQDQVLDRIGADWTKLQAAFMQGKTSPIHQAMFHHRSLFEVHGRFDDSFRIAGDYDLLLRELQGHDPVYVPIVVSAMAHGGVSSHPVGKMKALREIMRARKQNGLGQPGIGLVLAWLRAWIHARIYRLLGQRGSAIVADAYRVMLGKRRLWSLSGNGDSAR